MVGVQIGKIMAQQPPQKRKMAVGGLVMGGSGRQDDVPILAMGGNTCSAEKQYQIWVGLY
jgi:hypothetical protein